ncbi:MAG: DUF502 domain-containing protein [Bacteroidota bacterium]
MKTTSILKYFLQGLLIFIPLGITVLLLIKLFQFFKNLFSFLGIIQNNFFDTIISLTVLILFIFLLGVLASTFLFKQFFSFIEERIENLPVIKHIYTSIKDFLNAFMGNKRKFSKPVLVLTNPQANIHEIGFITQNDLNEWELKDKIAIYLPQSYSFSGRLIILSKEQVIPLKADSSEAMKFIISGGLTDVDKD